jgi:hypothetical protein
MAGVAFVVEGDGVGFATESYATSALYTTLANLSGALWRIRRVRSMIEQRTRDYFNIAPEQPVHVNAWAASQRAYWREHRSPVSLGSNGGEVLLASCR